MEADYFVYKIKFYDQIYVIYRWWYQKVFGLSQFPKFNEMTMTKHILSEGLLGQT